MVAEGQRWELWTVEEALGSGGQRLPKFLDEESALTVLEGGESPL